MPADYIARHKPDAHGIYTLTTDPPDSFPVRSFAGNPDLRLRMFLAYSQRAYPKNEAVLMDLLSRGSSSRPPWGTPPRLFRDCGPDDRFREERGGASRSGGCCIARACRAGIRAVVGFAKQRQPGLKNLSIADTGYWAEQYRRTRYDFDAQSVRPYFPTTKSGRHPENCCAAIPREFKAVPDAKVWDPSVSTFDVYDNAEPNQGKQLGRIYLDMHPRAGKDKWFSSAPLVPGIAGRGFRKAL